MPSKKVCVGAATLGGAVCGANAFVAPGVGQRALSEDVVRQHATTAHAAAPSTPGWSNTAANVGVAVGVVAAAAVRNRRSKAAVHTEPAALSSSPNVVPIGKGGFIGATGESLTVISRCIETGKARASNVPSATAMRAGADTKVAINGFGRIGRNVLRCWLKRETKPFDIVAINAGSMSPQTTAHLLKYDTVLGTLKADVSFTDEALTIDGKEIKLLSGRDPTALPWKDLDVEVVIESTGAFNSLEGGSKHLEAGAKKVVLTAPGKNCPTYVVGVNEKDYDPANDTVVSNASCTTNGMSSVCKVLDENFGVEYGLMTTTHSYTGDQMILDGRHRDLRRARAGACNIVPTSTGAAKAVAEVLPQFKGKLSGIALRVPTPNVSVVDLVVKVSKKCSKEDVNAALKTAADGPMKGIINFEEQPLVSSDFMQTDYSNSVDAALTMVMGEDLVKVVMWYDNEWGYSQRVVDLTQIVADTMPAPAVPATEAAPSAGTGISYTQQSFAYPSRYEEIASTNPREKKTDIICTIGPKSWDPEVLVKLMKAGMNIIRCNMSHGDHEEQSMKLANLEKAYEMAPEFKGKMKVLMDTRGPEIRTGKFEVYNSKKELKAGQEFKLICDDYDTLGDESKVAITYEQLPKDCKAGQRILIQDGTVVLDVVEAGDGFVNCKVVNDCKLGEKKNVNVPGVKVEIPVVGEREIFDIKEWAVPNNADFIALSFVQSPEDVKACRKQCGGKPISIISKIENVEGLKNFDAILEESDGIMVARGDLGMEIPMEKIWMAQKMMIQKTKAAGKYIITATEMLASMEDKPFPTRAEACDVANAVLDGTDAVMLSSESAMGDFPVETVTTMSRICEEAEAALVLPQKQQESEPELAMA